MEKDEYLKVLDFLEHGRSNQRDEPVAQGIGTNNYTLLEVVMRDGFHPKGGETLYIGEGDREKVQYIKDRISFNELTNTAQTELKYVVKSIVTEQEDKFVDFLNNATPITPRRHAYELLPGVGEKNMQRMVDEKEDEEFESYEDFNERVEGMSDIQGLISERIVKELKGDTNRYLFVES